MRKIETRRTPGLSAMYCGHWESGAFGIRHINVTIAIPAYWPNKMIHFCFCNSLPHISVFHMGLEIISTTIISDNHLIIVCLSAWRGLGIWFILESERFFFNQNTYFWEETQKWHLVLIQPQQLPINFLFRLLEFLSSLLITSLKNNELLISQAALFQTWHISLGKTVFRGRYLWYF